MPTRVHVTLRLGWHTADGGPRLPPRGWKIITTLTTHPPEPSPPSILFTPPRSLTPDEIITLDAHRRSRCARGTHLGRVYEFESADPGPIPLALRNPHPHPRRSPPLAHHALPVHFGVPGGAIVRHRAAQELARIHSDERETGSQADRPRLTAPPIGHERETVSRVDRLTANLYHGTHFPTPLTTRQAIQTAYDMIQDTGYIPQGAIVDHSAGPLTTWSGTDLIIYNYRWWGPNKYCRLFHWWEDD